MSLQTKLCQDSPEIPDCMLLEVCRGQWQVQGVSVKFEGGRLYGRWCVYNVTSHAGGGAGVAEFGRMCGVPACAGQLSASLFTCYSSRFITFAHFWILKKSARHAMPSVLRILDIDRIAHLHPHYSSY